eukprot:TRINITY_DN57705_c0_g1_i1.p1 TRINITY_DN57705_c0_g1~~TRINITY_DN57705_c0_g1_i1.p1  ORF type:complete len:111 (+),score=34.62 TRINITY_DN57705_c0_g1_i1:93-425(+)
MIRRPPRSTLSSSSAASDVYKRQALAHVAMAQRLVLQRQQQKPQPQEQEQEGTEGSVGEQEPEKDPELERVLAKARTAYVPATTAEPAPSYTATDFLTCLLYTSPSPRDS